MRNKLVAALLALFLGALGVHKFYLGKKTQGIVFITFFILGFFLFLIPAIILGIIAFVEGILLLSMSEEEFNLKYNEGVKIIKPGTLIISDEIEKLYNLKEKGIITEEEFEERKRMLL